MLDMKSIFTWLIIQEISLPIWLVYNFVFTNTVCHNGQQLLQALLSSYCFHCLKSPFKNLKVISQTDRQTYIQTNIHINIHTYQQTTVPTNLPTHQSTYFQLTHQPTYLRNYLNHSPTHTLTH